MREFPGSPNVTGDWNLFWQNCADLLRKDGSSFPLDLAQADVPGGGGPFDASRSDLEPGTYTLVVERGAGQPWAGDVSLANDAATTVVCDSTACAGGP